MVEVKGKGSGQEPAFTVTANLVDGDQDRFSILMQARNNNEMAVKGSRYAITLTRNGVEKIAYKRSPCDPS